MIIASSILLLTIHSAQAFCPPTCAPATAYSSNAQVTISSGAANTRGTCTQTSCFNPQVSYVNVGGTVTWTNDDNVGHTATSGKSTDNQTGIVFDSSLIKAGGTYTSPPFTTAGTYDYFCMVHPWMTGEIIVGTGSSPSPPVPTTPYITVTTDRSSYTSGEIISFSGHVSNPYPGQDVAMKLEDPSGNVMYSSQISLDSNGNFASTLNTAPLAQSGQYTLYVQVGDTLSPGTTAQTQFTFTTLSNQIQGNNQVVISNGAANTRGTCSPTDCYNPQVININVGSSVTWTNEDVVGHTVTSGHPSDNQTGTVFDSSLIASGRSYTSPAFNTPGTYPYFCQVHPWMTGEIIVGQGGQSLPPTTTPTGFSVSTDKSSYSSGSTVTITTYSSGISAGQNVAILVTDPLSNVVASRTIQFNSQGYAVLQIGLSPTAPSGTYQVTASASVDGNYLKGSASFVTVASVTAPPVSSGVSIVSVQATNQLGNNVVTSYGKGTTGFAKVVISSTSSQSALITVNLVGSDGTSLGVGSIDTSLGTGISQMIVSFYIPTGASVGTANIYADVYSDWPTNGGTPLTPESSSEVGIQ